MRFCASALVKTPANLISLDMSKLRKASPRKISAETAASPVLGLKRFAAISAVEGLKLTAKGRKRVASGASIEKRRADVLKAYLDLKGHR